MICSVEGVGAAGNTASAAARARARETAGEGGARRAQLLVILLAVDNCGRRRGDVVHVVGCGHGGGGRHVTKK